MIRHLTLVSVICLIAGCGFFEQARTDYQLGVSTPTAEGELTPREAAEGLLAPVSPLLPEPAAGIAIGFLTFLGTYFRGRRVRKNQPLNPNPITGTLGNKIGAEVTVQSLATVFAGLFEVGAPGSGLRRGWKVLVAGAIPSLLLLIPQVAEVFAQSTTGVATFISVGAAFISGLQKELQKVQPVKETT